MMEVLEYNYFCMYFTESTFLKMRVAAVLTFANVYRIEGGKVYRRS